MDFVAPQQVESSWTRDRIHVPCTGIKFLSTVPPEKLSFHLFLMISCVCVCVCVCVLYVTWQMQLLDWLLRSKSIAHLRLQKVIDPPLFRF